MVSVIIPVYNGEKYIRKCVDSLELENNTGLEVIAVDDGSKDNSYSLLCEYAAKFSNFKIVKKEVNEGLPQAKKSGLAAASGQFVAFLDVDDYVDVSVYAKMEEKAIQTNADLVFCDYIEEYPNFSRVMKSVFSKKQAFPLRGKEALVYVHKRKAVFQYPWNKLYRTDLLRQIEFPHGNFVGEDYYVLLRFLMNSERVDYVDMAAYHYVLTDNSMSRGGYTANTVRAYNYYKDDHELLCRAIPDEKRHMIHYLMTEYMGFIVAMGRNDTYDKQMIKEIKRFVRRGLLGYLFAGYVPFKMKGSAMALCFSYQLLIWMYRFLSK